MGSGRSVLYNVTEVNLNEYKCSDRGLVLPLISEYTWPIWVRALFYFSLLMYLFLGIARIADIFMTAIEQITSTKRKIKYTNADGDECFTEKRVWNATVANLSLMALGSSCPEILLAIIEIVGNKFQAGDLGPGTIVGSAAYNLLMISGLCVCAIKSPKVLRIENFKVFLVTTFFSIFAYIWLYLVLAVITPDVVDLWEAILTLAFFAILIVLAYLAEKNFYIGRSSADGDDAEKASLRQAEVDSSELKTFIKRLEKYDLKLEEKQKLIQKYLSPMVPNSRLFYRIRSTQMMTGSNHGVFSMRRELLDIYNEITADLHSEDEYNSERPIKTNEISKKNDLYTFVEFTSSVYAINGSNSSNFQISVKRSGNLTTDLNLVVNTKDCTAFAGIDYVGIDYLVVKFENGEQTKEIDVELRDSTQEQGSSKIFFVNYTIPESYQRWVKRGTNESCMISITNSDDAGEIQFADQLMNVHESDGEAHVKIVRLGGANGSVSVNVETYNISAADKVDYIGLKNHTLVFENGEKEKTLCIQILDDKNKEDVEEFGLRLSDPEGGVRLGQFRNIVVAIHDNDEVNTRFREALETLHINPDNLAAHKISWAEQFRQAANVNDGDTENASVFAYFMHCLSFPWKIIFAFVPPPGIWGGWLCFVVSIASIGVLTALVGDAAAIFGCLVNLKDSITAISLVAMGTSLPDTFASVISANNEKTADNAIGNVTGSNSVNVFLGLGIPWVLAAIYWQIQGTPFTVKAGDLSFSIVIFSITCFLCLTVIFLRRFLSIFGKGELGGPVITKWATTIFFTFLWVSYITLSALKAYDLLW